MIHFELYVLFNIYLFGCLGPPVPRQDLGCILWEFSKQRMNSPGVACRLSCSTLGGILVPRPGIKPMSPALQSRFLTTGPYQGSPSVKYILTTKKKGSWGCCIRILSPVGAELHWTPKSGSQVWLNYCTISSVCFLCGKNKPQQACEKPKETFLFVPSFILFGRWNITL